VSILEPDLTPGTAWLAGRTPAQRKRQGQWVTPYWICRRVLDVVAPSLPPRPRILDPACGDGRWLVAAARRVPDAVLFGWDLDPGAIRAARQTLDAAGVDAVLHCGDALAPDALPAVDLVAGNPPYVRPQHLPRDRARDLWARFDVATNKSDLYACFVQRALDRSPRAALVLPEPMLSLSSFAALRRRVLQSGLGGVYQLPKTAFDATVRTIALVCDPEDMRRGGSMHPNGLRAGPTVHVGSRAWSLSGPPPELPGPPLGARVTVHMGVVCGDYPRYVHDGHQHPDDRPTCRGRHVHPWRIDPTELHIRYDPRDMLRRKPYVAPKSAALFDVPHKVVLAGTSGTAIRAAMDTARRFPLDSCYVIHPRGDDDDPYGILGLLLSRSVGDWYAARFTAARVKGVEIAGIPAPTGDWSAIAAAARTGDQGAVDRAVTAAYALTD